MTITVPGAAPVAPDRTSPGGPARSRRQVLVGLALLGVLGAGAVVATAEELPPPANPTSADGLQVLLTLDDRPRGELSAVRLQVLVVGSPPGPVPPGAREVGLVRLSGQGLRAVPVGDQRTALVELGPEGEGRSFRVDVVVDDCAVEPSAPRQLDLVVERAGRVPAAVRASSGPDVVRALDHLVSRACGRPRG